MKYRTPYQFERASRWRAALVIPALLVLTPFWLCALAFDLAIELAGVNPSAEPIARAPILDVAEWLMEWAGFHLP